MANIALQMYSLREMAAEDFVGTLKKVSEIGYHGVEFAGYGGLGARELRKILFDLQLQPVSSHVPFDQLENQIEEVLEYATELGLSYIVCPFIAPELRRNMQDYQRLAEKLEQIAQKVSQEGLHFAYHNHDFEFIKIENEQPIHVLLGKGHSSLIQAELDIYWIAYTGENIASYLHNYTGRADLLHVKDMSKEDKRKNEVVGSGRLDIPAILHAAQTAGVKWYIVEQETYQGHPMRDLKSNFIYLSQLLSAPSQ